MRRYETVFVCPPELPPEDFEALIDRYTTLITDMKGVMVKVDVWGKRRLAYPIEKKREGRYTLFEFVSEDKVVSEMERIFKYDDNIMRFQTVKLSSDVDLEALEIELAERQKEKAMSEAPSPAEESVEPGKPEADSGAEAESSADKAEEQKAEEE